MESYKVDIWGKNTNDIVKHFFNDKLPYYKLISDSSYGPFWTVKYCYQELSIIVDGDIGFTIDIIIDGTKFSLWQYDRRVIDKSSTSVENLLFQLNILKQCVENLLPLIC